MNSKKFLNRKYPINHVIIIDDYEFLLPVALYIHRGDSIEFRLSDNIPAHVEHQLFGRQTNQPNILFESPLLTVCFLF